MNFRTGSSVDGLPLLTTQQVENLISNFLKTGVELEGQTTVTNIFKIISSNQEQFSVYKDSNTPTLIVNTLQVSSNTENLVKIYGSTNITNNLTVNGTILGTQLVISQNSNTQMIIQKDQSNNTIIVNTSQTGTTTNVFTVNRQVGITNNLTVNGNIIGSGNFSISNIISSTNLLGNLHTNNIINYSDIETNNGFWMGIDNSNPKVFIGSKTNQKYLEYNTSDINFVGNMFGHFYGDSQLFNLEIKSNNGYNSIVSSQDVPYIQRNPDGTEYIKTIGKGKHYIISLQNSIIKPANQYSPSSNLPTNWTTVNTSSPSSGGYYYSTVTSNTNTVFYKVEIQLYKSFPSNYFKSVPSTIEQYQSFIFDFSDNILYNTTYTSNTSNKVKVSYNPNTRDVKVEILSSSDVVQFNKSLKQTQDISYIKFRCYIQDKPISQTINNDMQLTFTTKESGHQLVSIQIDSDQIGDVAISSKFNTNTLWANTFGIVNQRTFNGIQTQQYFADLQEFLWKNDTEIINPGNPVQLKNGKITKQYNPWKKFWITSKNPGFIMGKGRENQIPIQLQGTVEIKLKQEIDDEVCLSLNGMLKKQTILDKILLKYIVGRVVKKLNDETVLILLY